MSLRLLAIDAATEACSVALWVDEEMVERSFESGKGNATQLLSMVSEVLAEASLSLSQMDAVVASIGPGAFTGVRISVAVAQGLAFGAGLGVVPVTTLEALAMQVIADQAVADEVSVLACLDARMGEVYWGCFAANAALGLVAASPPRVNAPDAVVKPAAGRCIGIGRGFAAYPDLISKVGLESSADLVRALPRAREFASLGALRFLEQGARDPVLLEPLYLRDKVAFTEAERAAR